MSIEHLKSTIRTIPDYPKAGIQFRDVTSLMADGAAFSETIGYFVERYQSLHIDKIVATEARGFIFGAPLAVALGVGLVPVRKPNKLPGKTLKQDYLLEYGEDCLEIHHDAISSGEKVLLIDDLLATGGTIMATAQLVKQLGGIVEHAGFVVSLPDLGGEKRLQENGINVFSAGVSLMEINRK